NVIILIFKGARVLSLITWLLIFNEFFSCSAARPAPSRATAFGTFHSCSIVDVPMEISGPIWSPIHHSRFDLVAVSTTCLAPTAPFASPTVDPCHTRFPSSKGSFGATVLVVAGCGDDCQIISESQNCPIQTDKKPGRHAKVEECKLSSVVFPDVLAIQKARR